MGTIIKTFIAIGLALISNLLYDIITTDSMEFLQNIDLTRAFMIFIIADFIFIGINIVLKMFRIPVLHHIFEWFDTDKKHLETENKYLKLKLKELERQVKTN